MTGVYDMIACILYMRIGKIVPRIFRNEIACHMLGMLVIYVYKIGYID